jgi:hypothetical protein
MHNGFRQAIAVQRPRFTDAARTAHRETLNALLPRSVDLPMVYSVFTAAKPRYAD